MANGGWFDVKPMRPFEIIVRFNPDMLIEAVADAAPIGRHTHDRGIKFKRVGFPRTGGRLKNWFRNRANWHLIAPVMYFGGTRHIGGARNLRMWTKTPRSIPYAAIQEFGGAVGPVAHKRMIRNQDGVIITAYGRKGLPSEQVAGLACHALLAYHKSGAAADMHLADQLVLPAALATGESSWTTCRVTRHLLTNVWVVQQFLDAHITVTGQEGEPGRVVVSGQ